MEKSLSCGAYLKHTARLLCRCDAKLFHARCRFLYLARHVELQLSKLGFSSASSLLAMAESPP